MRDDVAEVVIGEGPDALVFRVGLLSPLKSLHLLNRVVQLLAPSLAPSIAKLTGSGLSAVLAKLGQGGEISPVEVLLELDTAGIIQTLGDGMASVFGVLKPVETQEIALELLAVVQVLQSDEKGDKLVPLISRTRTGGYGAFDLVFLGRTLDLIKLVVAAWRHNYQDFSEVLRAFATELQHSKNRKSKSPSVV